MTQDQRYAIAEEVVDRLMERGWRISFAESCTGGLAAARSVDIPNASRVLDASIVTYANEAKTHFLGVSPQTLEAHGAVSEETAREMAEGICRAAGAEVGVAVSGIAGPSGGTAEKPVGTVCFGFCINGITKTVTRRFGALGRRQVREAAVDFVFDTLKSEWEDRT